MARFKIEHHKEICIGCGACAAINPDDWVMEGDKSHLIDSGKEQGEHGTQEFKEVDDSKMKQNQEAADACPVPCIFVKKISD
ncbi:MAG TPA: ferredoxin [archaeon]|nr:ferredoxin [archaeon]